MVKILAIDDNNDNLITLGAIIRDSFRDSVFETAISGKKGIELAISTDPDVILLDIIMPDMDGFEVCRRLKQDEQTRDIPVVFLTAMKEGKENRIKALEVGGEAFLYKPIDEPELIAQIASMVKIKQFTNHRRNEKDRLLQLVAERTQELERSQAETLKLLNELKAENEKYRKTEEELKESEERYRLLHESAGAGIGYYTPEGTVISYNTIAALHMNGKPEDFAGKSIYSLFPKEDAEFYMDRIKKAMNSESRLEYEDKVELPTEVKWFHSVFTRIQDSGNQVIGVQIISTEITEQKKIENALHESEIHFRTLANSGQALIWTSGIDKKCNYFNQPWLDFTGRTIEQELGDGWVEGVHPDDLQQCVETYVSAFDRQEKFSMEYRVRHFSGEYRWIQDDGTPRFNSKGEFIGFIGHCLDITERKQTEDALKRSESKFRMLFAQMSEGFALHEIIYDVDHIAVDYKILEINPAFEKQVGIQAENANGALATQLYGVSPAPYIDIYAQVAETGEHYFFQTYFPPLDRYFQISVFSPNPGSFATIFVDITERKLAEDALKESEAQLRELVATKDKFFSILAHDLKSPFNSILGLSNMLVEQVREKNHEGIEEYTGIIQKSTQRVFDLLMNLLEWARTQTGRMDFSREYIELGALINEVIELLGESARQKSITIIKELPRNMLVFADKAMINTVLRNLISNAIKFTYSGGQVVISADKKPSELMISISDNGIGIKKEVIGKLFRIDENHIVPGTQNEKGTGLGLILCKEFIEKHGGKIWVESEVGKGSLFCFTIPKP
jgi:PAS domain S-box-containing protein